MIIIAGKESADSVQVLFIGSGLDLNSCLTADCSLLDAVGEVSRVAEARDDVGVGVD